MFAVLILCSLPLLVQQQATKAADSATTILDPVAPSPFDRVIALELTSDDKILDGHGVARRIDYEAAFSGTLHVWTQSELDLLLRVEGPDGKLVAEDDNSGGGMTPYLAIAVEPARRLVIVVAAASPSVVGCLELHLVAAPESDATRAAAAHGRKMAVEAAEFQQRGELEAARERVATAREELLNAAVPSTSDLLADVVWEVGQRAFALGQHIEARDCYLAAYRHCTRTLPRDHRSLLASTGNLAGVSFYLGNYAVVRELEEHVLAARQRTLPPDDPLILMAEHNLAGTLYALGELDRARSLQEHVLSVRQQSNPPGDPLLLSAMEALANTLLAMHEVRKAIALQESVVDSRARASPIDVADFDSARHNLAMMLVREGDLFRARALQESVLASRERTLPPYNQALLNSRNNLADTLRQLGDLPGALAQLQRPVEIRARTSAPDDLVLAVMQINLAEVLREMGRLEDALALQESVLAALERALQADDERLLMARGNLSITKMQSGDLVGARALAEQVVTTRRRVQAPTDRSLIASESNLADLLRQTGELANARAILERVEETCAVALPADDPYLLAVRINLALTAWQAGDADRARAALSTLIPALLARATTAGVTAPREARERIAADAQYMRTALGVRPPGCAGTEHVLFELAETLRCISIAKLHASELIDSNDALAALARRVRHARGDIHDFVATASRETSTPAAPPHALADLVRRRDQAESELRRELAVRGATLPQVDDGRMASSLPDRSAAIGFLRYQQMHVDDGARTLCAMGDGLLAHVLLPDGTLTRVELGPVARIVKAVDRWRTAIDAPLAESASVKEPQAAPKRSAIDAGRDLRRLILDPVLAAAKDANELFVCLDDVLHLVPLDALPLDDADRQESTKAIPDGNETKRELLVGDRYQIHVLSSFGRLIAPRPAETGAKASLLALGGIDYDATPDGASTKRVVEAAAPPLEVRVSNASSSSTSETRSGTTTWPGLSKSLAEADAIAKRFQATFDVEPKLLTGASATKAAFFDLASDARWIHVATHGWFAPESIRSFADPKPTTGTWSPMSFEEQVIGLAPMTLCGLALAGANRGPDHLGRVAGLMTAEEIGGLDLGRCELVVLSACETNVGLTRAGQGIQSLQAALDAAGARASITSLWKVGDSAAKALFDDFYERIWVRKQDKSTALWEAKMALRAKGYPRRDWAAWVLCGDPR